MSGPKYRPNKELIKVALHGMANWIETGDFVLSAEDLLRRGDVRKLKHLSYEQSVEVYELREMAEDPSRRPTRK